MINENIKIITKSPGKCLICGGYLILNKNKKGVVFNIDTYIESKCEIENYELKFIQIMKNKNIIIILFLKKIL